MAIVYAVLIAVVVGALVAMQAYFKRALQLNIKRPAMFMVKECCIAERVKRTW